MKVCPLLTIPFLYKSGIDKKKVLKGTIRETRFATPMNPGMEGPLVQTSQREFGLDKVTYMADAVSLPLHVIGIQATD